MCTALSFPAKHHYFGRTLDLEYRYDEAVVITPRAFPLLFREREDMDRHYAIMGVASVLDGIPLYYDAINECGLAAAGLNFTESAVYLPHDRGKENLTHFEIIPRLLGECRSADEACKVAENICITAERFRPDLPAARLHWLVADKSSAFVLEQRADGMHIIDNPARLLTNEPPLEFQLQNLKEYINLTPYDREGSFSPLLDIKSDSRGSGAIGLPGDFSSASRFVRAAFVSQNAKKPDGALEGAMQFFHILSSLEQIEGCIRTSAGLERTQYVSCYDTDNAICYYKTYECLSPRAVSLKRAELDADKLAVFPMRFDCTVSHEN